MNTSDNTMAPSPESVADTTPHVPRGPICPRIAELGDEIRRTVNAIPTSGELLRAILELTMRRSDPVGVACFVREGSELHLGPHKVRQPRWQAGLETRQIKHACVAAIKSRKLHVVPLDGRQQATAICIPVVIGEVRAIAFLIPNTADSSAVTGETVIAQLLAVQLGAWHDRLRAGNLSKDLSSTAATLELVRRVEACTDLTQAGYQIVSALKEHLKCEQVVLGISRRGSKGCRVTAISDVAEVDDNAVLTRRLKAVLDESLVRGQLSAWPPLPDNSSHQLLAHKQIARRDESILSVPLRNFEGKPIGAIAVRGNRELPSLPDVCNFIETLDEPLGSALHAVQKIHGTWLSRSFRTLTTPQSGHKRLTAMVAAVAVLAAMTIPTTYRIGCRTVVEPVERRFCVAPHDGLLENTLAEPGDVIEAGQRLANMDGREIRLELASIEAEFHRASKDRDTHRASHEVAKAVMAELEMETLENRRQLLKLREAELQVSSPINGVVLSGSLDRRENFPVTKGQVLYEVAPLNPLRIEVAIPSDEIPHVAVGMWTNVFFDGLEGEEFEGRIASIRPRSEVRHNRNVFVAEVQVKNPEGRIRPGMEGRAKIDSHAKSIGWILFHRAWERIRTGWPF